MTKATAARVRAPARVTEIPMPADLRALGTLSRIDYEESFLVDAGVDRSPEQWARAMIEDASLNMRARLVAGWTALGLRLGAPWAADRVLGWKIEQSNPDFMLLKADSPLGLHGELLFRSQPRGLLFATLIQHDNAAARGAWKAIIATHQAIVRSLLADAAEREASRWRAVPA